MTDLDARADCEICKGGGEVTVIGHDGCRWPNACPECVVPARNARNIEGLLRLQEKELKEKHEQVEASSLATINSLCQQRDSYSFLLASIHRDASIIHPSDGTVVLKKALTPDQFSQLEEAVKTGDVMLALLKKINRCVEPEDDSEGYIARLTPEEVHQLKQLTGES